MSGETLRVRRRLERGRGAAYGGRPHSRDATGCVLWAFLQRSLGVFDAEPFPRAVEMPDTAGADLNEHDV